jgi:hypothetical protein
MADLATIPPPLDPRLDRLPSFDEKSRLYQIRTLLDAMPEEKRMRGRSWTPGPVLDQGREGACVGFACTHRRNSLPIRGHHDNSTAIDLYRFAQTFDEWPGENYSGTSVLGGMKAGKARGWWNEYRWIGAGSQTPIEDFIDTTIDIGPVVLGINWKDSMMNPRPSGLLDCSGVIAGGHAILGIGVRLRARLKGEGSKPIEVAVLQQSWGLRHGVGMFGQPGGFVFIKLEDLESLLNDNGEGAVPIENPLPLAA